MLPPYRRRGVGTALLGALADQALACGHEEAGAQLEEAGQRTIALETDTANPAVFRCRDDGISVLIGDESVRRHYRREFDARLRRLFDTNSRSVAPRSFGRGERWAKARDDRWPQMGGATRFRPDRTRPQVVAGERYVVASPQLTQSPVHRGHRAAIPRREALILQAALNHPWLLHDHLEDLASVEFRHSETEKIKSAFIDIVAHDGATEAAALRAQLETRGLADPLARIEKAITTPAVWGARPEAAPADVLMTWNQLVALHRQWHSLIKELKDAELALGQDASEANYSWLRDVKTRLSVIDGTEALVEGFGASSGRAAPSF